MVGAGEAKRILFTLVVRISYAGTTADYAHEYTLHPSTGRHEETHWSDADDLGATVRKHLVISGKQFAVGPERRFSYYGVQFTIRQLGAVTDSHGKDVDDVNNSPVNELVVELDLFIEKGHGAFTSVDGYHEIVAGSSIQISVKVVR